MTATRLVSQSKPIMNRTICARNIVLGKSQLASIPSQLILYNFRRESRIFGSSGYCVSEGSIINCPSDGFTGTTAEFAIDKLYLKLYPKEALNSTSLLEVGLCRRLKKKFRNMSIRTMMGHNKEEAGHQEHTRGNHPLRGLQSF